MISVFDGVGGTQVTIAAVVGLIGVSTILAWLPATRRDPTGLATRVFITVGLVAAVLDPSGVGAVLGLSLAAMGGLVWWEGRPAPEVPRPRRRGFYVAAVLAGLVTYGTVRGWGPLDSIPRDGRPIAALFVGLVAVLGTLAIADRARITFRDRLRRRFSVPTPKPRVLVAPIDRLPESSVTLERLSTATTDGSEPGVPAVGSTRLPAALLPADVADLAVAAESPPAEGPTGAAGSGADAPAEPVTGRADVDVPARASTTDDEAPHPEVPAAAPATTNPAPADATSPAETKPDATTGPTDTEPGTTATPGDTEADPRSPGDTQPDATTSPGTEPSVTKPTAKPTARKAAATRRGATAPAAKKASATRQARKKPVAKKPSARKTTPVKPSSAEPGTTKPDTTEASPPERKPPEPGSPKRKPSEPNPPEPGATTTDRVDPARGLIGSTAPEATVEPASTNGTSPPKATSDRPGGPAGANGSSAVPEQTNHDRPVDAPRPS